MYSCIDCPFFKVLDFGEPSVCLNLGKCQNFICLVYEVVSKFLEVKVLFVLCIDNVGWLTVQPNYQKTFWQCIIFFYKPQTSILQLYRLVNYSSSPKKHPVVFTLGLIRKHIQKKWLLILFSCASMDQRAAGEVGRERRAARRGRPRAVVSDEIRATVIDHVINHGLSYREAGLRVQPRLFLQTNR